MTTQTTHSPNKTINDALADLASVRDEARLQMHLFSLDAKQRWSELEAKLLAVPADSPAETALAGLRELTRAARIFIDEHRPPAAGTAAAIMTKSVRSCSADDSLNNVARILWEADCGAVPVTDADGVLLGIITERDVCMATYTRGQPLWACSVASVMSTPVHHCAPGDSAERIAEIMREHQVRRLPVATLDGRLLGMVSLADIARFVHSSGSTNRLPWFAATVAAISTPHAGQQAATAAQ